MRSRDEDFRRLAAPGSQFVSDHDPASLLPPDGKALLLPDGTLTTSIPTEPPTPREEAIEELELAAGNVRLSTSEEFTLTGARLKSADPVAARLTIIIAEVTGYDVLEPSPPPGYDGTILA